MTLPDVSDAIKEFDEVQWQVHGEAIVRAFEHDLLGTDDLKARIDDLKIDDFKDVAEKIASGSSQFAASVNLLNHEEFHSFAKVFGGQLVDAVSYSTTINDLSVSQISAALMATAKVFREN